MNRFELVLLALIVAGTIAVTVGPAAGFFLSLIYLAAIEVAGQHDNHECPAD